MLWIYVVDYSIHVVEYAIYVVDTCCGATWYMLWTLLVYVVDHLIYVVDGKRGVVYSVSSIVRNISGIKFSKI